MATRDRTDKVKAAILRGVYEDNLELAQGRKVRLIGRRPAASWGSRLFVLAALAVALFGGVGPQPPSPIAEAELLAPDAEIEQQFGVAEDPGLQLPSDAPRSLASVYGLGMRRIVLDPGHGGRDGGAVGPSGLTEKAVVLDIARRLERRLLLAGFEVFLTRHNDVSMTIRERVDYYVKANADIMVSIHVNALESDPRQVVETYFFNVRGSAATEHLAMRENANSGITLGEWRSKVGELAHAVKQEESRRLAEAVQGPLSEVVRQYVPEAEDWGAKGGPFMVLSDRWSSAAKPEVFAVPAVLTEVSVINTPEGEALLRSDEYRERLAGALMDGILAFAKSNGQGTVVGTESEPQETTFDALELGS